MCPLAFEVIRIRLLLRVQHSDKNCLQLSRPQTCISALAARIFHASEQGGCCHERFAALVRSQQQANPCTSRSRGFFRGGAMRHWTRRVLRASAWVWKRSIQGNSHALGRPAGLRLGGGSSPFVWFRAEGRGRGNVKQAERLHHKTAPRSGGSPPPDYAPRPRAFLKAPILEPSRNRRPSLGGAYVSHRQAVGPVLIQA
jgi:hypothetical protein